MPKKNSIINNTPPQEKILIEDAEPQTQPELTKPKKTNIRCTKRTFK